ncbi:MAG TPA: PIG-L family deacetylase [Dyella sp.]|uniref:PIG-L deacetylase family protein n=1 Tax=Dyella sp. TaxID=1869338 RepID=UPI002C829B3A|nr:PIG-L family deacetylase [Dyella sp.]HUB88761.1 PIG-L family deacetylase [Dyella sp.]
MPPWPVSAQTRLLVLAPHPDDETLGCGILLQQVLAAGGEIRILLLTDGDNNPWPQRYLERRLLIDSDARVRWGVKRRAEVVCALERLGAPASALHPLGWHDMELTDRLRDEVAGSLEPMRAAIAAFRPTIVCSPALRDSHPDHGAAHVLCRLALAGMACAPMLLAYPVHGGAESSAYPISVDATATQRQCKLAALLEHRTQMVLSGRRMLRLADSPERYMSVSGGAGNGWLPWQPPAVLRPWLRLLLATPAGVKDWPWPKAPLVRDAAGVFRLAERKAGPAFVKLHLDWPSPWIFDHWGWWEV